MLTHHWTSAILGMLFFVCIIALTRKHLLDTRYSLWWFSIAVLGLTLGLFPGISDLLAAVLGASYPPILILLLALLLIFLKLLLMDVQCSTQERAIKRLSQRVALLEATMEEAGREIPPASPPDDRS